MCNVCESLEAFKIISASLHNACDSLPSRGTELVALGHRVKKKHSHESVESLAKHRDDFF